MFRLAASLPASVVEEMRFQREHAEKRILNVENERDRSILLRESRWNYFDRFEKSLAGASRGPFWLRKSEIAEIVAGSIKSLDGNEYELIAFSIMPNHVHGIIVIRNSFVETMGRETDLKNKSFVETTGSVVSSSSETTHRVVSTGNTTKTGNKTKTLQPNSLGSIIGQFKSVCTKRIYAAGFGDFGWQSACGN